MTPLSLIKLLRPILPGWLLQRHLTNCAAYEVLQRGFDGALPALTIRNVLGLRKLPHQVFDWSPVTPAQLERTRQLAEQHGWTSH